MTNLPLTVELNRAMCGLLFGSITLLALGSCKEKRNRDLILTQPSVKRWFDLNRLSDSFSEQEIKRNRQVLWQPNLLLGMHAIAHLQSMEYQ